MKKEILTDLYKIGDQVHDKIFNRVGNVLLVTPYTITIKFLHSKVKHSYHDRDISPAAEQLIKL